MKYRTTLVTATAALAIGALALTGCAAKATADTDTATIDKYCGTCHSSDFSSMAGADWAPIADSMVTQYGAQLTDAQKAEAVTALEATY